MLAELEAPQPYSAGELVGAISGLDFSASPETLLLVLSSDCRFCTQSMPFYRTLVERRDTQKKHLRIVAVGNEAPEALELYVTEHSLRLDGVHHASFSSLRVHGTPTLIGVDQDGRATISYTGQLTPVQESRVLTQLGLASQTTQ